MANLPDHITEDAVDFADEISRLAFAQDLPPQKIVVGLELVFSGLTQHFDAAGKEMAFKIFREQVESMWLNHKILTGKAN